jgi:hypothetical protein
MTANGNNGKLARTGPYGFMTEQFCIIWFMWFRLFYACNKFWKGFNFFAEKLFLQRINTKFSVKSDGSASGSY